ncbi:MAG TPA: rod shape-determining protein MreC [Candidatus Omnitrophota bacterium]|nr:rod shape-determining protein MreC [Candidatus Omnitrophota bacterium]
MERKRPFWVVALILIPLLLAGRYTPLGEIIRSAFFSLTQPVLSVGAAARQNLTDVSDGVRDVLSLFGETRELRRRVAELESENAVLRDEEYENNRLRIALDLKKRISYKTIVCRVLARDVTHLSHWAVLSKGSRQGIRKEMPVVNEAGLVGKVVEVGPQTSRMILLRDMEARVSALIERTRDAGLVMGTGGTFLEMKFIDLESDVKVGDVVVTAGLGDIYPQGILIGKVESLARDKKQMHLVAQVRPAVSFSRIEEVLCLNLPRPE